MTFEPNPPQLQAHICVKGGLDAITFYEKAFGAKCPFHKMANDDRRVMHANIELFGGEIILHDEFPEFGGDVLSPSSRWRSKHRHQCKTECKLESSCGCRFVNRTRPIDGDRSHHEAAGRVLGITLRPNSPPVRSCLGV